MTARPALPDGVLRGGVVAVLRADDADRYLPVCRALAEEGVTALEVTLTTPGTLDVLPALRDALPHADIGVGTVLTTEDLRAAVAAGAGFLVTPVADPALVRAARAAGTPIVPGAMTPTEVRTVWAAGASAVKVFPAATVGADYLGHLAGPFPGLVTMPSGGVGLDDVPAWIRAGAAAVSLGGPLVGDALAGGDEGALRERARTALARVRAAREAREARGVAR
ncbi:bifunctional 4-hydroxy-2-oxoglutarate aldolase/2-dehydro-3-deoxy-phosphogluconate aldolase [Streptomyces hainanensis]|uniref:bifunctional 4-hydroxy-2-oxoglutarate aldolase/2-dehydro-3-deoxy-phosphogluconate aldolase n=1 Tax=Streptomyces hainanensis TaxID=402648 RepID=UPI001A9F2537|nr:bifunctional 4-hydroxy-2-oxoglutarate aldolase/2-dehydro-3-deoxy-phosphogluconate aldolase [Streptomyces hainanensis]